MRTKSERQRDRRYMEAQRRAIEVAKPELLPDGLYRVRYTIRAFDGPLEEEMTARPGEPYFYEETGHWSAVWVLDPISQTSVPGPILEVLSYQKVDE